MPIIFGHQVFFLSFLTGCGKYHGVLAGSENMNIRRLLDEENILMELKSTTKEGVIGELLDLLVQNGRIKDRNAALKAIMEREQKMSTGMQHGIAIPHGKADAATVDKLVTAFGIKREGIDFGSLDGKPSQIFIMTISPVNRTGPHIQFLAEMSQILNDPQKRENVLNAKSAHEVMEILSV
jgi:fructose-specific phosphotransferase system IIA component